MKGFMKTTAGKTILFILCIISATMMGLSSVGALIMAEEDLYTRTKEEVYSSYVRSAMIQDLYPIVYAANDPDNKYESPRLAYAIYDEYGNLFLSSDDYQENTVNEVFEFRALKDEEGDLTDIFFSSHYNDHNSAGQTAYKVKAYLKSDESITDRYAMAEKVLDVAYPLRYGIYGIIVTSLIAFIAAFVALMCVGGRRIEEGLYPGPLNNVPFDVLLGVTIAGAVLSFYVIDTNFRSDILSIASALVICLFLMIAVLGLCMSLAVRVKQKNLIKGSLTYKFFCFAWGILSWSWKQMKKVFLWMLVFFRQIPLVWKVALPAFGLSLLEMILLFEDSDAYTVLWFLRTIVLLPLVLYICMNMLRLQKGGQALAKGDLSYHIDTKGMILDLKEHGNDLNEIAKGMSIAVEDRLKSERMKTELITNVSHDIKTPLTSIINYADLISKQRSNNKKISEYSEVLLRQSEKLKRLLEDLVEASKASSGNLEVNLAPFDASIFIEQSVGEYQEKLEAAGLKLVSEKPEEAVMIMADGRRMYRIFDNLMNNICKYAQSQTRVYLTLHKTDEQAVFEFKNTSRDALNISPDELMERFTRGDSSRNSDGNGLGLSIAKSLTELQNGTMDLKIDGDLFKVTLTFPLI
ncbi:MAG: HAMP domain-containing histidine kinase [Erysipelotrichaceae bacterium]|nr:HAMP domain-containing histidine kinase [Erysipelotrichaceae bacterium]